MTTTAGRKEFAAFHDGVDPDASHTPKSSFSIESPHESSQSGSMSPAFDDFWPAGGGEDAACGEMNAALLAGRGPENASPPANGTAFGSGAPSPLRFLFRSRTDRSALQTAELDEEKCRARARETMQNDVSSLAKAKLQMVRDAKRQSEQEAKLREKANRETGEKLRKLEAEVRAKVVGGGQMETEMKMLRKSKRRSGHAKKFGYTEM